MRYCYRILVSLLFISVSFYSVARQNAGYRIQIDIENATASELYLAYHFGEKQFIADTARMLSQGSYVFEGEEKLEGGIYLVAMPPTNKYFELLIDPARSQNFSVATDTTNYGVGLQIEGSEENQWFYDYIGYLNDKRAEGQSLQQLMQSPETPDEEVGKYEDQLQELSKQVKAYQEKALTEHEGSLMAAIIRANEQIEVPEPPEGAAENFKLYYYRDHYFDNIDWSDQRLLRTPILEKKLMDYMDRLHLKTPDSLIVGVDNVLKMAFDGGNEEVQKYTLSRLLNEYAKSKLMGMDAVYVHIAENYYAKGKAPWVDDEQLSKIIDNARRLSPILLGKKAPNLTLPKLNGEETSLYDVNAKYTVLYFWDPDCGNCSKASTKLAAMYDKYKAQGVEIFGVCNKTYEELGKCIKKEEEKEMKWINTADPYGRGRAHAKYYVRSNPLIFLLDEDKIIRYKRIDPDQLKDILNRELGLEGDADVESQN